jgi:hypothetical protein
MTDKESSVLRVRNWDGLAALIAASIGVFALLVSGYTAYIQRQQVRAQVWPFLLVAYADGEHSLIVLNKGVGPALVHGVELLVDDKPQRDWKQVVGALGLPDNYAYEQSTISSNVLSAGERIAVIRIPDAMQYQDFSHAMRKRVKVNICYCSTLGDCWLHADVEQRDQRDRPVDACPALPEERKFND